MSDLLVSLDVLGTPKPQGSKRAFVVKGRNGARDRAVVVDTAKAVLRDWRSDVIGALREEWGGRDPYDGAVKVGLVFWLPAPKKRQVWPSGRVGDVDKLSRTVLDAIEIAGVVTDDARVCDLRVVKTYPAIPARTGVRITVSRMELPF